MAGLTRLGGIAGALRYACGATHVGQGAGQRVVRATTAVRQGALHWEHASNLPHSSSLTVAQLPLLPGCQPFLSTWRPFQSFAVWCPVVLPLLPATYLSESAAILKRNTSAHRLGLGVFTEMCSSTLVGAAGCPVAAGVTRHSQQPDGSMHQPVQDAPLKLQKGGQHLEAPTPLTKTPGILVTPEVVPALSMWPVPSWVALSPSTTETGMLQSKKCHF